MEPHWDGEEYLAFLFFNAYSKKKAKQKSKNGRKENYLVSFSGKKKEKSKKGGT